jgi:hypothetical protein
MSNPKLRQAIAAEAARLLQQRKEPDYHAARRKAARWFSRQRVSRADMPSYGEIQQEVFALTGLFSSERQHSALNEMRLVARDLLALLNDFQPQLKGSAITGPVMPGAEIELVVSVGDWSEISVVLFDAGHRFEQRRDGSLTFFDRYRCVVSQAQPTAPEDTDSKRQQTQQTQLDLGGLDHLLATETAREQRLAAQQQGFDREDEGDEDEDGYHPDFFPTVQMMLNNLESIRLDPAKHPEGDLLYHTLQVYELGLAERPYDEEFLLACLLHDIGVALDRRHPLEAAWQAIGQLVTPRTWFFIENRAEAVEYLATGRIRGTLKRSEDFEELVLLAKCDVKGRVRGAKVSTVEEALEYVEGLSSAWDDA